MAAVFHTPLQVRNFVSTHSHPKVAAWGAQRAKNRYVMFQHTATRRWLLASHSWNEYIAQFQHTATRRWLLPVLCFILEFAAGFNTQPPEGGCAFLKILSRHIGSFNTQPPEGGCFAKTFYLFSCFLVSTHSHPKVAALVMGIRNANCKVSTHSHPKVAAAVNVHWQRCRKSFNTQPPEGGCNNVWSELNNTYSFNTQPPEGGCQTLKDGIESEAGFQHTATRRWLLAFQRLPLFLRCCFNTQPPEGGCQKDWY